MEEAGWQVQTAWFTSLDNFTKKLTLTRTEQTVPKRKYNNANVKFHVEGIIQSELN